MDSISIGNRTLNPGLVVKVKNNHGLDDVQAADKAAFDAGADSVVFKMAGDTYLAAGRGMDLRGVQQGDVVTYQGQKGVVLDATERLNTAQRAVDNMNGLIEDLHHDLMPGTAHPETRKEKVEGAAAGVTAIAVDAVVTGLLTVGKVGVAAQGALRRVDLDTVKKELE